MKLHTTTNTIEHIGNVSTETGFKMRSSRKAFQILSDLYSDKPLAIVRELGCNAHDSHVEAGKANTPFHIHAPNALEPWITIQDFGTGISHENIYNIYAVYFESTKTNTNDQIGCLGLGSKSPFCYTDNFTITSVHNGTKRIYNAFFNADAMPAISLLSTDSTTDENGIAIQIPVKPEDFFAFEKAIKKSFRFFDVRPTISGGSIMWDDETPILSGKDWAVYKSFGYNEAFAIMGGVTYPLDVYKINDKNRNILQRAGVVLKFQTGELDIVPSREGLSYNPQTITTLNEKVENVIADIKDTITDTLTNQTNIVDAIRMYNTLEHKFSMLGSHFNDFKWNGYDVGNPSKLVWDFLDEAKIDRMTNPIVSIEKRSWGRGSFNVSNHPTFGDNTNWYVNDLPRGGQNRVKEFVKNNNDRKAILIKDDVHKVLLGKGFPASIFTMASTLPSIQKVRMANAGTKSTDITMYKIGDQYHTAWDSNKLDPANPPKYYIVKGKTWDLDVKIKDLNTITSKSELCRLLSYMKINHSDVVMVSKRNSDLFSTISTPLEEYVEANLNLSFDADELASVDKYLSGSWVANRVHDLIKSDTFKALDDTIFKTFITKLYNAYENITINNKLDYILPLMQNKQQKGTAWKMDNPTDMDLFIFKSLMDGCMNPHTIIELMKINQKN